MSNKVFVVTNIARPYRIPLFKEIARQLEQRSIEFEVIFYSNPQKHHRRAPVALDLQQARFKWTQLSNLDIPIGPERVLSFPYALPRELKRKQPDVIITGGFSWNSLMVRFYARRRGVPYVIWSGAAPASREDRFWVRRKDREFLVRGAAAYIAYSSLARQYLEALGASPERIFLALNAVDTKYFGEAVQRLKLRKDQLKWEMGAARYNLLYVGQLIPRKGVEQLLQAAQLLSREISDFRVHIVGTGPLEGELKQYAKDLNIDSRVRFWGFRQQEELTRFYATADLFVFPSLFDIWGLVVNEALACGLPVIASERGGVTHDLIEHGVNGFVVDPRNIDDVAQKIKTILLDEKLRNRMSYAAMQTIQEKATIEHSAYGFVQAIEYASHYATQRREG